jgi:peptide/nickel transport system substrate-binding protein
MTGPTPLLSFPTVASSAGAPAPVRSAAPLARGFSIAVLLLSLVLLPTAPAVAAPEGQMTWAVHVSLAPVWFDPAETTGIITPFMFLYAMHDALVKPMPGQPMAPSLAESWTVSKDGLTYEFVLRQGVKFHNGDLLTAEDVKFSIERYRGAASGAMKARIAGIDVVDPHKVRIRLKQPWPDFMTFLGTPATGAGWIVPKKYVEKVGDDGFKKAPVGAGPYKFVSFTPGVELVLEAYEGFWRKTPSVKRLVFKAITDEATRLAALKRGEVDVAYSIRGALAEELQRTPGLTLKPNYPPGTFWLVFAEQWDPKSPFHDKRVRQAVSLAIDRGAINKAETLGLSKITGSMIPANFEFFWQPPLPVYDVAKAKQLLAQAGHPNGLDAGEYYCDSSYSNLGEAVVNYLQQAGIRVQLRPLERAAFLLQNSQKKLKNIIQTASGAFGNAATRIDAFVAAGGTYTYGTYRDVEGLIGEQAADMDPKKREATLHRIQQLITDKAMVVPIWELAFINGHGPRVAESGLTLIQSHAYSAPYEDVKLKK